MSTKEIGTTMHLKIDKGTIRLLFYLFILTFSITTYFLIHFFNTNHVLANTYILLLEMKHGKSYSMLNVQREFQKNLLESNNH